MSSDLRSLALIDIMPESIASDEDVIAMASALDPEMQDVAAEIEDAVVLPRITELDALTVEALAYAFDLYTLSAWELADITGKRRMLADIFDLRRRGGTVFAVRRCFDLLRLDATVIEWFDDSDTFCRYRLDLDASEAGLTLLQLLSVPELARRFEPARARLTAVGLTVAMNNVLYPVPVLATGITLTVTYGGP